MSADLSERLVDFVEGSAPPVVIDELAHSPYVGSPRTPHNRTPWFVGAAVVALGTAVLGTVAVLDVDDGKVTSVPITTGPAALDPSTCGTPPGSSGCEVDAAEAEEALGIPLPTPTGIPEGWTLVGSHIRYWPAGSVGPGVPDEPIADLNQVWAPAGTDLTTPGAEPTYLQLTRRARTSQDPGPNAQEEVDGWLVLSDHEVISGDTYVRVFAPHVDDTVADGIIEELTGFRRP